MLYDTIAEGIRANLEDAKVESRAEGKAEGKVEGKAELLADVIAHMYPEQTDAFQRFLNSRGQEAWLDVPTLLSWTGTGGELMDWLVNGRSESS